MPAVPPPIDWEAPYGRDWHAVRATLIYGPTATRALFEVERKLLQNTHVIKKTGIWAQLPDTPPRNASESLFGVYRILRDCESDYWVRYKRER
jgi:hypothetical protein